jgi:thiol-disulfide isomerase/thioredoxin
LAKYKGKPTLILIAGTYCPHCQKDVPEIEEKIFDKTNDQINLIVNVIDGVDGARFDTKIKQVVDPKINFELITGNECNFVPS